MKALKITLAIVTMYTLAAGYGVYKALTWRP
jgi:hypothetical protein